jgi:hypothetical protein
MDERGIEGTTAVVHGAGADVWQVLTVNGLENFIEQNIVVGSDGEDGVAGREHVIFTLPGQAQLATGSKPFPLPYDADILFGVPFCGTPPTEDPITFDLKVDNVSIVSTAPFVPVGAYSGEPVAPTLDPYPGFAGNLVTVDVTSVGMPEEGGDVVMDVRSVSAAVSSLSTTKSNFNIPIPGTLQIGDLMVCCFVTLAQTVTAFPVDWVELVPMVEETTHPGSLHLYVLCKIAEASESAVQTVVFSGGTPMQAVTLALKNPQVISAQPDDSDSIEVGVAGDDATLPAITSSLDNDFGLWIYATRYFEGIQDVPTLDVALTSDYAATTTRASQTNCGLAVGHKLFASPATSAAYQSTVDSAIFARWVGRNMMLFQGNAGGTPGVDASLDVYFRERV